MPKRLGYKTDSCMMLIRREINEWMIEKKINKSKLVNDLLLKYYQQELCPTCFGGGIRVGKCQKCKAPWVRCENIGAECQDAISRECDCSWEELYGL